MARRVALVTGSSRGIGRAIAIRLAREGHRVAVNYRKRVEEARKTVKAIIEAGGEAEAFQADVSKPDQVDKMFEEIESVFGPVEILVNNAGWGFFTPVALMDYRTWERHIAVNLDSVFICTRRALPSMIKRGWGRILNITSVAGLTGLPGLAAYSAAKAGIIGFTKALAAELQGTGVTVNAIAAGFTRTEMGLSFFQLFGIDADEWARRETITGRLVEPEEVAELAAFLVSDKASAITGQVFVIDGGLSITGGSLHKVTGELIRKLVGGSSTSLAEK